MTSKQLEFGDATQRSILRGVSIVADAVGATLGRKGRNVVLERSFRTPLVTKDGVSVAREIELESRFENIGVQVVREAAFRTADLAGDGTTTATDCTVAEWTENSLAASGAAPEGGWG